ncbi:MAG: RDD family protein [Defluviitaleaceae bacterium]|nr:RDD family protein [Defluviitaleaceae bacterium]
MFFVRRLLANAVDLIVFFAIIVGTFIFVLPFFLRETREMNPFIAAGVLVFVCGAAFLLQYPFMRVNQTIGKALLGLRIISTNPQRPMTAAVVFQREVFAKAFTCYFMCVPVLFNKEGQHDVACETEVV